MSQSFFNIQAETNQDLAFILWQGLLSCDDLDIVLRETSGTSITLLALKKKVNDIQLKIREYHLPSYSKVALCLPRGIDYIASLLACWEENLCVCPCVGSMEEMVPFVDPSLRIDEGISSPNVTFIPLKDPCPVPTSYIITTSGSSGPFKMVAVPPFYLPSLWINQSKFFQVDHTSHTSWMLSPNFDASFSDIGVALSTGSTLLIATNNDWSSPKRFLKDLEDYRVSHIDAPPSFLNVLRKKKVPSFLKTVVTGGEVTPSSIVQAWGKDVRWVNVYGPTEATVCTSMCVLHPYDNDELSLLGEPLPLVSYALINEDNPVPHAPLPNEEGELCISGPLAHGYVGNPEKTQESFPVFDGVRWYKTGDWVKYDEKWGYRFLFRLSRVVKHLGKWVLLDEMEEQLSGMVGVDQAIVHQKDGVLQGFIKKEDDFPEDVIPYARKMFPQVKKWHMVDTIPLQNGKIARGLL